MDEYIYPPIILITSFVSFVIFSRHIWDIVDTPTVSPSGAIIGLCEIIGKAAPPYTPDGKPVPLHISPLSKIPCVWYSLLVEKHVSDGNKKKWKKYKTDMSVDGFRIADKYGSVAVHPTYDQEYLPRIVEQSQSDQLIAEAYNHFIRDATEELTGAASQWTTSPDNYYMWHPNLKQWIPSTHVAPDRMQYYDDEKKQWMLIADTDIHDPKVAELRENKTSMWGNSNFRVTEIFVLPDTEIFSHGYVNVTKDGTDLKIGRKKKLDDNFVLSPNGENHVLNSLRWKKWISFIVWLGTTLLCAIYIYHFLQDKGIIETSAPGMAWQTFAIPSAIVIIMTVFGSAIMKVLRTFNRFVRLREQVRLSRSAIDITLKRRSTLIPQLCEVMMEIMKHETTVLESVSRIRSEDPAIASKDILALAESYPTIHSSENFLHLQNELGRTEEKIAMARSFLNDSILAMDNLRATFVGMLLSPLFAKEKRPSE